MIVKTRAIDARGSMEIAHRPNLRPRGVDSEGDDGQEQVCQPDAEELPTATGELHGNLTRFHTRPVVIIRIEVAHVEDPYPI